MKNLIVIFVIIIILSLAIGYIAKAKKRGVNCIGCPSGKNCSNCSNK